MSADIFKKIALEIQSNNLDPSLWTRAFGETDGDEAKAKALYIRLRHAELAAETGAATGTQSIPLLAPKNHPGDAHQSALDALRSTLQTRLFATGKSSFYANLGLTPVSGDNEIAHAVGVLKTRETEGEVLPPEIKYAIEAIGTPARREAYDRKLFEVLTQPANPVAEMSYLPANGGSTFLSWWGTRNVTTMIAVGSLLLFGVLSLNFFKTKVSKDVAIGTTAVQREATKHAGENDAYRAGTERRAVDGVLTNQERLIERAAQLENRREDTNQRRLEYQANYGAAQIEMQRAREAEQLERQRQDREQARSAAQQREAQRAQAQLEQELKRQNCANARQSNNAGQIARHCN